MKKEEENKTLINCEECGSKFFFLTSKMASLCPECAHVLYGYQNCNHKFENGKCVKCHWNGSKSHYVKNQ